MSRSFRRALGDFAALGRGLVVIVAALALLALVQPAARTAGAQEEDVAANATIRIVHASPGAPDVDVLLDGQPLAQGIVYGSATDYVPLTPANHQLQVVPTGQPADSALIDQELEADSGAAYIFVVRGTLNEIEGQVVDVNLDATEEGMARARVVNAAPDAGEIDIAVTGGDTLFDGVAFEAATDYQDIEPGTLSFDLRGEEDRALATVPEITIQPGRVYDLVAIGQVSDQSVRLLPLETNVSRPCTEVLGLAGSAEDACVRIVHAAAGAADIDAYVNDSALAEGVAFAAATEYVIVPAGEDRQLRVTAAGASVDEAILETETNLTAGQAYQAVVTGEGEELEATVNEINLTPLPENQSRLRVIHASQDVENVDVGITEGPTLVEGIEPGQASDYATVDSGAYTLEVRPAGEATIAVTADAQLEPGVTYDAVAVGRAEDQSLELLVLASRAAVREGALATPGAAVETTPGAVATVAAVGTPTDGETDAVEQGEDAAETVEAVDVVTPTALP